MTSDRLLIVCVCVCVCVCYSPDGESHGAVSANHTVSTLYLSYQTLGNTARRHVRVQRLRRAKKALARPRGTSSTSPLLEEAEAVDADTELEFGPPIVVTRWGFALPTLTGLAADGAILSKQRRLLFDFLISIHTCSCACVQPKTVHRQSWTSPTTVCVANRALSQSRSNCPSFHARRMTRARRAVEALVPALALVQV